ncbi:bifunctional diguanylate cyclase/phosphodiesterase [Marinobacterium rhizophilum]|uniref:EAL domain-containing protein n=1 Tax=Marinobacterium rhizophilum TaxID=420402 RepID=A0ABY5HEW4_9GAMM|nr:EAL domain-containing protein [Marinobacterium rhizophilum]UTW10391.1 EAL domain-containing protein [Marinobacterium rhizophilum]
MHFRTDATALPRYLIVGMIGTVLLLLLVILSYLTGSSYVDRRDALDVQAVQVRGLLEQRLVREADSVEHYAGFLLGRAESVLRDETRERVDQAYAVAEAIYLRERGRRSAQEIQALIGEALRNLRFFSGRGYIFIDDLAGNAVLAPQNPEREGKNLLQSPLAQERIAMRGLLDAVRNPAGAGYFRYRWEVPGSGGAASDKITYVRRFDAFDWIIGTGDYVARMQRDLQGKLLQRTRAIRFNDNGFIAVLDRQGRILDDGRPADPEVGVDAGALQQKVLSVLPGLNVAGLYVTVPAVHPVSGQAESVLGLVRPLPLTNWVQVALLYPSDANSLLQEQRNDLSDAMALNASRILTSVVVAAAVALLVALFYARWIKALFVRYQQGIDQRELQLTRNAQALQLAARVFESSREGIIVSDADNRIRAVNGAYCEITGYSAEDALGRNPSFMSSGRHDEDFYRRLWCDLAQQGRWQGEVWNRRKNGEVYPEWLSIHVHRNADDQIENYIATFRDISERKRVQERLSYLASYDTLTDLPNQRLFEAQVGQAMAQSELVPGRVLAVLLVDLDRFRNINDSLGHDIGDRVLQSIAARLAALIPQDGMLSRQGGDEFALLLPDEASLQRVAALVQALLQQIARPVTQSEQELVVTPSIGVAVYPQDGSDYSTLLRNADAALSFAKAQGRNQYQFFMPALNRRVSKRLQLENALRQALVRNEFRLVYQPQYYLERGLLSGSEALLRWHSALLGPVGPADFIPLAEETGLMGPIGDWVLQHACEQGAQWLAQGIAMPVAVNVSACQFLPDLPAKVAAALNVSGFEARLLVIEVTESALMQDIGRTAQLLRQLKALGVEVALDDFGTGHSSLAYLKRFALDKLKIDRSFISGLPEDADDTAIIKAMLDMARHLGLKVVAEGIETVQQQDYLASLGCEAGQGYLYAKPLAARQMTARLAAAAMYERVPA